MSDARLNAFADRIANTKKLIYGVTTPEEINTTFADIATIIGNLFQQKLIESEIAIIHHPELYKAGTIIEDHPRAEPKMITQFYIQSSDFLEPGLIRDFPARLLTVIPIMVDKLGEGIKEKAWTKLYTLELPLGLMDARYTTTDRPLGLAQGIPIGPIRFLTSYNINIDDYVSRLDVIGV